MRKLTTTLAVATASAVALAAPATGSAAAKKKTTITLSGSTSVQPLAALLIKGYLKGPGKGKVSFKLAPGGSDVGIGDVARGRVTIGNSSRDPKPGVDRAASSSTRSPRMRFALLPTSRTASAT